MSDDGSMFTPQPGNPASEEVVLLDVPPHKPKSAPGWADIERVAASVLAIVGEPRPPVSALALADSLGFEVKRGFPGIPDALAAGFDYRIRFDRGLIEVPAGAADRRLHELVATALGEWVLVRAGFEATPDSAGYVAAAMMMPLRCHETLFGDSLRHVAAVHRFCSVGLISRRLEAYAALFGGQRGGAS